MVQELERARKSCLGVFGFLLSIATALFLILYTLPDQIRPSENLSVTQVDATPTPEANTPRAITIAAAGDLMAHQRQLNAAKRSDGSYDFSNCFTEIAPYIQSADVAFANLETTLLGKRYRGYPQFCTPDSYLDAVKSAGFDVLTTANNHCLDTGLTGLLRTIDTVRAYGFYQTGTYKSPEDFKKPLVIDVHGIKVGIIAYTHGVGRENAVSKAEFTYCVRIWKKSDYAKDVQACRDAGAEIVIASVHWGKEFSRSPSGGIRAEAKKMLEAGVDLILGSHPHVVQPVETIEVTRMDGSKARCAVAYSLGNFISNQRGEYTCCGMLFRIKLREDEQGRFQIADMGYVPTYVSRDKGYTNYRVLPVAEYASDPQRLAKLDKSNRTSLMNSWNALNKLFAGGQMTLIARP